MIKKCKICNKKFNAIKSQIACSVKCSLINKRLVSKNYSRKNKKKLYEKSKKWRKRNRLYWKKYQKNYRNNNKKQKNEYYKNKYNSDIIYKLTERLRQRTIKALKRNSKSVTTIKLIGCSLKQLKQHLETQFKKGMAWKNWGKYGWHIDHIRPCYSFDLSKESQQRKCFNYRNLQPLWAYENLKKGKKCLKY